jgi:hypothetical protein
MYILLEKFQEVLPEKPASFQTQFSPQATINGYLVYTDELYF